MRLLLAFHVVEVVVAAVDPKDAMAVEAIGTEVVDLVRTIGM